MTGIATLTTDEAERLEQLRDVDFLSFFSEETLVKLARSCAILPLSARQVLFEEGDESDAMYIILSGELLVYRKNKVIARRKSGEYIGEMGLIESKPRSAAVMSALPTQLLEITQEQFHAQLSSSPDALMAIMKTLSDQARDNLKIFKAHDSARDRSGLDEVDAQGKLEEHVKYLMREAGLTSREADVARLICDGLSDKEIAKRLGLSHHTVKDYIKRIYSKFRVHARAQLVSLMFE